MPELPEVETVRRGLAQAMVGKKIKLVRISDTKTVRGSHGAFKKTLEGKKISGVDRRAKLLIFSLSDKKNFVLVHLKMTGQLIFENKKFLLAGGHPWPDIGELPNKYTRVTITFTDNSKLFFNDVRKFGYMQLVDQEGLDKILAQYGPETLLSSFSKETLTEQLASRKISLKAALLHQGIVAGIGNIYADEICFVAGVRPSRSVNKLTATDMARLWRAMRAVLRQAIRYGGTTFQNFHDAQGQKGRFLTILKVYGRGGQPCVKCGRVLKRTVLAGRGTVYCDHCQQ